MSKQRPFAVLLAVAGLAATVTLAQAGDAPNSYVQINLVGSAPGSAKTIDSELVDAWGVANAPTGPFWVNATGAGLSPLYDGRGNKIPVTFVIPPAAGQTASEPTGMVWNSSPGFIVPGTTSPAVFIFATLSGTLSAWTAGEPTNPLDAVLTADNSAAGAHYTGVEFATTPKGGFLYAANIGTGTIDVFDSSFKPANALLAGQFVDPAVPAGYTPFNIRLVDGSLVVTYAKMNASHSFVTPGPGLGYVAIFDTSGRLLQHLASAGELNAPWGIAKAPLGFGAFSQDLLIGDFGNGWVLAYGSNGRFHGLMRSRNGAIVTIPGLWTLTFGNALKSDPQLLYFTAGPDFGQQGLFGRLEPAAAH